MSDAAAAMQARVHETIPISRHLDFQITSLDDAAIRTRADFQPNVNVHGTAFAGSQYSLAVLTAWSYTAYLIDHHGLAAELVVANGQIRYAKPVSADIECECHAGAEEIRLFVDTLAAGRRAKLSLDVSINHDKAVLQALMVATPK